MRSLAMTTVVLLSASSFGAAQAQDLSRLQTAPERTNFEETTRYDDVVAFMQAVAAASPLMHYTTFGFTQQGRALPMVVVGRVADASPAAVLASGRTRVYLQGNIHAGEVEGKESLLILLREIAQGRHLALLDSMVLLVAPIYNADGNEAIALTNRPSQHGPVGGMGTRPTSQGYNLNRDHTKLDAPESRSLALMLQRYDPHVGVDLHTTNGTRHAYHLTYSPPLHPNTHESIIATLRERWLPQITDAVRAKHGWEYYYYGNVSGQGDTRGWYTFDHKPRFNNNYLGLRNRFAILSEAYSYATFEDRILATSRFIEEILHFAHANAAGIRSTVEAADRASVVGQTLALRAGFERSAQPVQILMGDVVEERNPYSGAVMLRRLDVKRPEMMYEYGTFRATESDRVPSTYLVPASLTPVLQNLIAHGVKMEATTADRQMNVERFRIDSTRVAERESEGRRERQIWGAYESATVNVPAGTMMVRMDQPLGRLVFTLIEPRSDDGLVAWNVVGPVLDRERHYPVLRVR
jgi:hypothetical protein